MKITKQGKFTSGQKTRMMTNENRLLLNYNDACIYESDLELIRNPNGWLNSSCIHFQMNRLQSKYETINNVCDNDSTGAKDIYMDPSVVSFFVQYCHDEKDMRDFCKSFRKCYRAFFPVNSAFAENDNFTDVGGGSHWSLLVMVKFTSHSKEMQSFFHFDSLNGMNSNAASSLAFKLNKAMSVVNQGYEKVSYSFQNCKTPQQPNGNDCGIYLLSSAEDIGQLYYLSDIEPEDLKAEYENVLSSTKPNMLRQSMVKDILNLAKSFGK